MLNIVAKNINQAINLLVASQRENFNVNSDNNINVVVTKDAICQTDIETGFQDLSDNENRLLITALNNHTKSLEKQLDEKQVVTESFLKNLQNLSYNNIVATSNHKLENRLENQKKINMKLSVTQLIIATVKK